jgi:hypothetical protein
MSMWARITPPKIVPCGFRDAGIITVCRARYGSLMVPRSDPDLSPTRQRGHF